MLISYNWLKEYVLLTISPEKLGADLTMAGFTMDGMEKKGDDYIFDLDVTTNRPDCMNHFGMAREIATIYDLPFSFELCSKELPEVEDCYDVEIQAPEQCFRYSALLIKGVKNGKSPQWLLDRLEAVNLRAVNGVVDITNFVLHELGHPLHAFDNNCLKGNKIIVRNAVDGEKIKVIDGSEKTLSTDMLVIADTEKAVAIAGVMGGIESEVSLSSTDILLESAFFEPVSTRITARDLGMHTDASHRFERGADIEITVKAMNRAVSLITEYFGGQVVAVTDNYPLPYEGRKIELRYSRVYDIIGDAPGLDGKFIEKTLSSLGLEIMDKSEEVLNISVPSFRNYDIRREIDLIEEIARHYGCDKIVSHLPLRSLPSDGILSSEQLVRRAKDLLCSWGFSEAINYSMVDGEIEKSLQGDDNFVTITNPLSEDAATLRTSLIQGLLKTVGTNRNKGNGNLKIFEHGVVFRPSNELADETSELSIVVCGQVNLNHWSLQEKIFADLFYLKGIVSSFFEKLLRRKVHFVPSERQFFEKDSTLEIVLEGSPVGVLGCFCSDILEKFDIEEPLFGALLNMDIICSTDVLIPDFESLPRVPGMVRELAFISDIEKDYESVRKAVASLNIGIIRDFNLLDVYSGKPLPEGKKSFLLSFRLQPMDKTLTHREVVQIERKIVAKLENEEGLKLRGTLDDV